MNSTSCVPTVSVWQKLRKRDQRIAELEGTLDDTRELCRARLPANTTCGVCGMLGLACCAPAPLAMHAVPYYHKHMSGNTPRETLWTPAADSCRFLGYAGAKLQVLEDFKARMLLEAKNRKERAEMEKKDAVLRFVAKLDQV